MTALIHTYSVWLQSGGQKEIVIVFGVKTAASEDTPLCGATWGEREGRGPSAYPYQISRGTLLEPQLARDRYRCRRGVDRHRFQLIERLMFHRI